MRAGTSDVLISRRNFGNKAPEIDVFAMQPYYELAKSSPIRPTSKVATVLEFVTSSHKTDAQVVVNEADIVEISREELDAKLGQNKAEVDSVAALMRQEMSEWREQQNLQMSQLTTAISTLSSKIDGKMDSVDGVVKSFDGKLEGIQGRIDGMGSAIGGINTAISGIQSGLSTKLTVFGIIITVVIALVGFGAAHLGKSTDSNQTQNPTPIVIQIPQQPTAIQNVPQTQK